MKTPRQLPQLPPMMLSATLAACALATLLGGCSAPRGAGPLPNVVATDRIAQLRWLDRVTWGASTSAEAALDKQGLPAWLRDQLHPAAAKLPAAAQAQIDGMSISQMPVDHLAMGFDAQRKAADALADEDQKKTAREAYRQQSQRLVREPQQRFLLRALYSPNQLQEQMTWFWMNHFNVNARKADIRALIGKIVLYPGMKRGEIHATLHGSLMGILDFANDNPAPDASRVITLVASGSPG